MNESWGLHTSCAIASPAANTYAINHFFFSSLDDYFEIWPVGLVPCSCCENPAVPNLLLYIFLIYTSYPANPIFLWSPGFWRTETSSLPSSFRFFFLSNFIPLPYSFFSTEKNKSTKKKRIFSYLRHNFFLSFFYI